MISVTSYISDTTERCPKVPAGAAGTCVEMCSSDNDCPNTDICCSNGCGHVCIETPGEPLLSNISGNR